jgi:hypothetical protein
MVTWEYESGGNFFFIVCQEMGIKALGVSEASELNM